MRGTHGLVLGKFMPPHRGHQLLVDFARRYVDELTVLVCTLEQEPIDGELRFRWMSELCGDARVVHVTEEVPQEPSEHPEFWAIWRELVLRHIDRPIDFVFASEDYGERLAKEVGARFVPVDPGRHQVPVSATKIRADPLRYWDYLPDVVRPYYVRRVCLFGPESTGKTTLSEQLAGHYETVAVAEYAREILAQKGGELDLADMASIARGQVAAEEALARQANRILFCDTDPLTTSIWSEELFGECPASIHDEAAQQRYDLTLLLDVDVPWVADEHRYFPEQRRIFFERCQAALEEARRPYRVVQGSFAERFEAACSAVDELVLRR